MFHANCVIRPEKMSPQHQTDSAGNTKNFDQAGNKVAGASEVEVLHARTDSAFSPEKKALATDAEVLQNRSNDSPDRDNHGASIDQLLARHKQEFLRQQLENRVTGTHSNEDFSAYMRKIDCYGRRHGFALPKDNE